MKRIGMERHELLSFSSLAKSLVVGDLYEHYKGHHYKIFAIARHSESLEELVIYQALYGNNEVWVRPLDLFLEEVIINERSQPRFKLIE
jgi:hypothetical protein